MSLYSDLNDVLTPYAQRIKGLAQENTELKADLDTVDDRLIDIDGIIFPKMELGTIGMSSSSIVFNNSTTIVRIGENNGIYVQPNDIIHITDYSIVKFRYALLQDDTGTYAYTSSWLTSDYRIAKNGRLWIIATYNDGRTITDPTAIAKYVRVVTTGGDINALGQRVSTLESYNASLANKKLPYDLFGQGTYGSGNYNPTFRTWRLSTIRTLTYDFDLYVTASSGWRFMCNQYVDGAWTGVNTWITSVEIPANTPFGMVLARNAADEDATSTATAEDFLPNFIFNVDVGEIIDTIQNTTDNLDDRVTALENEYAVTVDTEKIKTYMYHFYNSESAEAYAFFTDPHLMGSAGTFDEDTFNSYIQTLAETVRQTSAAYVVSGGDWLNREDTKAQASAKLGYVDGKMRSIFPSKYYPIAGNHDFNYIGYEDGSRLPEGEWITNSAMRNFWFHDHEQCYYKFKVMTAQNYVLNTRTDYDGTNAYDKTMLDWLASNLIEDDAEHSTIMFHIMHLSNVSSAIPKRVVAIGKIIEAYNSHTVCTLTDETEGYEKTYDFTGTTGKIDYVIVGHTHADFTETFGGVPVIGCVNFTSGNTASFDLVFADYTNGKVYTTRIGSGENREFNI